MFNQKTTMKILSYSTCLQPFLFAAALRLSGVQCSYVFFSTLISSTHKIPSATTQLSLHRCYSAARGNGNKVRGYNGKYASKLSSLSSDLENDLDTPPTPSTTDMTSNQNQTFVKGQEVSVKILQFGPLGASVSINNNAARGLVLQTEIAILRSTRNGIDVTIGEELTGYVGQVRDDGKLNIAFRKIGMSRLGDIKAAILEAIEGSPLGSIPIGDKSDSEDIAAYLHGVSKKDFKLAVGQLYKDGKIKPGQYSTALMTEEDKKEYQANVDKIKAKKTPTDAKLTTIFIGNLPTTITEENLRKAINGKIGEGLAVRLRLALDDANKPRGFAYVDMKDESSAELAIQSLKGLEVNGRKIRTDLTTTKKDKSKPDFSVKEYSANKLNSKPSTSRLSSFSTRLEKYGSENIDDDDDDEDEEEEEEMEDEDEILKLMTDEGNTGKRTSTDGNRFSTTISKGNADRGWSSQQDTRKPWTKSSAFESRPKSSDVDYNNRAGRFTTGERSREPVSDERRSRRDGHRAGGKFTLYVGNLAYSVTEDILCSAIEKRVGKGVVSSVRLITEQDTGRKKGYGYVDFDNEEHFEKVGQLMQGFELMGRPLRLDSATRE